MKKKNDENGNINDSEGVTKIITDYEWNEKWVFKLNDTSKLRHWLWIDVYNLNY